MLVEKPDWVSHGGASIFAVDVHPAGTRFATGGADSKVRIWALAPLLEEVASSSSTNGEENGNPFSSSSSKANETPRLLATLSDNLGSVNAVRFSESGKLLATGADDGAACVFELRGPSAVGLLPVLDNGTAKNDAAASSAAAAAAQATRTAAPAVLPGTAFIGGGPPSLEQWKLAAPLRAHTNNVTDVAWSPGDRFLATASLDNTVVVWEISSPASSSGQQQQAQAPSTTTTSAKRVATLEGHESYVKGVSFDPLGKYVASQSDDASVIVWRTEDWQPAAKITEPFAGGTVSSSFSTRLSWAPDGTFLVACNAFDRRAGVQLAPVVSRAGGGPARKDGKEAGPWESTVKLVGHSGAVVASRTSGKLFVPFSAGEDDKDKDRKDKKVDLSVVGRAVALGAQDGKVSVWVTTRPMPVVVASRFFKQSVVDLAWTPDGYALLAVSSDGTLACFQFERSELGRAVSEADARELRREMFGDERARTARFAETAGQLMLEKGGKGAAAPPASASERLAARMAPSNGTAGTIAATSAALPPGRTTAVVPMGPPPPPPPPLFPRGGGGTVPAGGVGAGAVSILAPPPAPPRQDSQRGGGKRHGHATPAWPLAPPGLAERVAAPVPSEDAASAPPSSSGIRTGGGGGAIEAVNAVVPAGRATATVALTRYSRPPGSGEAVARRCWEDVVPGGVSSLVSSRRFSAAATGGSAIDGGGSLLLWSRAGRRLAPPLTLSAPIVSLATDDDDGGGGDESDDGAGKRGSKAAPGADQKGWKLLAITADGGVYCWDVRAKSLTLRTSLAPLLSVASAAAASAAATSSAGDSPAAAPLVGLASARICRATGAPTVVLTDLSAAVFDLGLGGWARVADGVSSSSSSAPLFAHSAFATSAAAPPPPAGMPSNAFGFAGELRQLQAGAAAAGGPSVALADAARLASSSSSALAATALRSAAATGTRAHLESNVAAAAALGSGGEWREWTLAYVRHLAADADEERLREVFEELLGPARLSAALAQPASKKAKTTTAAPPSSAWSPTLGGVDKRALLRDALSEASRNRELQRVISEFSSLLEYAA